MSARALRHTDPLFPHLSHLLGRAGLHRSLQGGTGPPYHGASGGGRGGGGPTSTRYRANLQSSYLCRFSQRSFDTIFTEHQRRTIRNKAKLTSASRPPLGAALSHGQPRTSTALTRRAPRPRRAQDRRKRPRRVARISCRARAHQLQGTRRERPEDSRSARFGLSAVSRRGTQRRLRPRGRPGGDVHVGRHWQPGPGSSAAVLEQVLGFPSSLRIKRSLRGSRRPRTARCTRGEPCSPAALRSAALSTWLPEEQSALPRGGFCSPHGPALRCRGEPSPSALEGPFVNSERS